MAKKKYYLVYQITNLINEKIYIGRHITNKIDDGYLGSGHQIQKAVEKYGRENFRKEILFVFDNMEEMVEKEEQLLTEDFVKRQDTYNLIPGGYCGMLGKTHTPEVREILRRANTGIVSVKDKDGNCFKVSKDNPRYISGELKHNCHGTVCVKDSDGNNFRVPIDDSRYLSGELVSVNKGTKQSEERVKRHIERMIQFWAENTHSEEGLQNIRDASTGKVNVKDRDGNCFKVSKDDERIKSGELSYIWTGRKHTDQFKKKNSENKKDCIWISNHQTQKTKLIKPDKAEYYLNLGWEIGRIQPENMGEKIKAGRVPGKWMTNIETQKTKVIHLESIDEYISNGWILGRIG